MDAPTLQDRISRGMGTAARIVGQSYDAFRPAGPDLPIVPENRFLRLHAAFNARDPRFGQASAYGRPAWFGIFDSAYTQPGDYLVGPGGTFFIAAQEHLLPPLCILTNATLGASRPVIGALAGLHDYGGGVVPGQPGSTVMTGWPASLLAAGGGGPTILPADGRAGGWSILLPPGPFEIRTADILTDDRGRTFVVGSAECTALGTRIAAQEATA